MPLSASFEYSKFGERGSSLLVRLWASRMFALAKAWELLGRPLDGSDESVDLDYEAAEIMEELETLLPASGRKRFADVCRLWPGRQRLKKFVSFFLGGGGGL